MDTKKVIEECIKIEYGKTECKEDLKKDLKERIEDRVEKLKKLDLTENEYKIIEKYSDTSVSNILNFSSMSIATVAFGVSSISLIIQCISNKSGESSNLWIFLCLIMFLIIIFVIVINYYTKKYRKSRIEYLAAIILKAEKEENK